MIEFSEIPVIDVEALFINDKESRSKLAKEFAHVYGTTGFGYITNHGIAPDLIKKVFAASHGFHALPQEQKMQIELNELHRGFIPINTSTDVNSKLAEVRRPNQSESFMMMREDSADSPDVLANAYLAGPNQWPDLDGFRETVTSYHNALTDLGRRLMEVVTLSLGADTADIMPGFERPTTWLRLLYYPPAPTNDESLYGSAPHCDFGALTILAQDDIGGLQVQTPSGVWVDAPLIPDALMVNVGDILHRWSNGKLLSTPHRVINRSGKPRYSCPFFYDPNVATNIAPLASCITPKQPAAFESINFGDFLKAELAAGYERHKNQAL